MPVSAPINDFSTMCGYVSRACYMANWLSVGGVLLPGPTAAVIASWNTNFNVIGPPKATLVQCAQATPLELATWWQTPGFQFRTRCDGFASDLLNLFPDSQPSTRPIADWATLISALVSQI